MVRITTKDAPVDSGIERLTPKTFREICVLDEHGNQIKGIRGLRINAPLGDAVTADISVLVSEVTVDAIGHIYTDFNGKRYRLVEASNV